MEEYLNQFKPRALSEERKKLILGPALQALASSEAEKSPKRIFWVPVGKMLLAASFLFVFGFNYWISQWNQNILQQYQEIAHIQNASGKLPSELNQLPYYDKFQEMGKTKQKLRQIQQYYLNIQSIK
ncbi:MAG: hypothetical protein AABZ60_03170 [Planctomycetota bacterium]